MTDQTELSLLGLQPRVEKALEAAGITTLDCLTSKTADELEALPDFGVAALEDVKVKLLANNLTLAAPQPGVVKQAAEARKEKPQHGATAILTEFAEDFANDMPPEISAGHFSTTSRDRWAERTYDVPDGKYQVDGHTYVFTFADGRFISADAVTVILDA